MVSCTEGAKWKGRGERIFCLLLGMLYPAGLVVYFIGSLVWGIPYWIWTGEHTVPMPEWFREYIG